MHCVDLGKSFQTHIFLQNFVSIQPRTSPVKFAASCDRRYVDSSPVSLRGGSAGEPRGDEVVLQVGLFRPRLGGGGGARGGLHALFEHFGKLCLNSTNLTKVVQYLIERIVNSS